MAKLISGMIGTIKGKAGNIVVSSWKGNPYVKAVSKKRTVEYSIAEKANHSRFGMGHLWLQPILEFVRIGFKNYSPTLEGFGAAFSHLLKYSIEGEKENATVNPALVKVSHGDLALSDGLSVVKNAEGNFVFSWDMDIPQHTNVRDQIMMLAYNPEEGGGIFMELTGQFRSSGNDILLVSTRKRQTYHVYAAFISFDRNRRSHSQYLGVITT